MLYLPESIARTMLVVGVLLISSGEARASAPPLDPQPTVTLTADGLTLDWRTSLPEIDPQADGSIRVTLPGYAQTNQPGTPRLPFASALIALPPGAAPELQLLQIEQTEQPLPGPLAIAPQPDGVVRDSAGHIVGGAYSSAPRALATKRDPIQLEIIGVVRGVHLARVTFYPVRSDGQTLRVTTRLRASLTFNVPYSVSRNSFPDVVTQPTDPLRETVRAAVVNPAQVQPISPDTTRSTRYALRATQYASSDTPYAVEVSSPGITALTYDALAGAGFPLSSTRPISLHLTHAGIEIAAEWDGNGDAIFESGERLLFYAHPGFSRYTTTDVYFLSSGATPGLRMSSRPAAPAGYPTGKAWVEAVAEMNALYMPDCFCGSLPPGRDGDRWTWDDVRRPDRASLSYPIQLPAVNTTQAATLTLWLLSYTDPAANPDHRVDVSINGAPLGHSEWNGRLAITVTLPITPSILSSGVNTLTLTLPGLPGVSVEGMWLDAFSIRYARGSAPSGLSAIFSGEAVSRTYTLALSSTVGLRAYGVTDADHPMRLSGVITTGNTLTFSDSSPGTQRYAVTASGGILSPVRLRPASSLQTINGADYVVIAPSQFAAALSSLIALRQSQGLSAIVENVQAIYDAYGDGRPEPDAIRAYLANAYATWVPPPTYVLLVGDGTFDPKRYRPDTPLTLLPPYLADVDPWAGETASDNRFVAVDGNDNLPDLLIGRLPVNTITETQIIVNKIVQYETQPFPGGWNGNIAFVADDPDPAGDFPAQSELLATTYITAPFVAQRIYHAPPATTVTFTQQAIVNQWNIGAGLIMFTGHSSVHQWAFERLFHLNDVPVLNNGQRLPVVLEMTCFTGSFQHPSFPTLDEALLRRAGGGAVAVWGATGLGVSTGHSDLADGFMQSLFNNGQTDLGLSTLSGKLNLAANDPAHLDLIDTFTLLGDPATHIDVTLVPWSHFVYLPSIRR